MHYFQNDPYTDCLVTCPLAVLLNYPVFLAAPFIQEWSMCLSTLCRILATRLFTVIYFIIYMFLWRSFWNLFLLILTNPVQLCSAILVSSCILMYIGCFNSVGGAPSSIALDNTSDYCILPTFNISSDCNSKTLIKRHHYSMLTMYGDLTCTLLLEILNIFLWFAIEELIPVALGTYPKVSQAYQCLLPVCLGFIIGILAFYCQIGLVCLVDGRAGENFICDRFYILKRKLCHWILSSLALLSSVLHWYGLWTLLDYFFLPNSPVASNILTATLGIAGMCLTGCSR